MRARELKLDELVEDDDEVASRPMRARELKLADEAHVEQVAVDNVAKLGKRK